MFKRVATLVGLAVARPRSRRRSGRRSRPPRRRCRLPRPRSPNPFDSAARTCRRRRRCRPPDSRARRLPARRRASRPRAARRSSSPRPTSITSSSSPASRPRATGCRTTKTTEKIIREDFHRLWNTNFLDNLWIEMRGLHLLERRHRQAHHLQHGGAAARQDRRLRRLEEGRDVEDRRDAEGRRWREIRLDTFIDPALVRKVAGIVRDMMKEKGFQIAEVTPEISDDARRAEARAPDLPHVAKVRRSRSGRSTSSATRSISDGHAEEADEGEHSEVWMFSFINGRGVLTRKRSSTTTPTRSPSSTATTATSGPTSASPS